MGIKNEELLREWYHQIMATGADFDRFAELMNDLIITLEAEKTNRRIKRIWRQWENDYINKSWGKVPIQTIANVLGRSYGAVVDHARVALGLSIYAYQDKNMRYTSSYRKKYGVKDD